MHHAPSRQLLKPFPQQAREIRVRGSRVQEQRQPDFDGDVELRGEVFELDFFGAEHQAVVVEADFAEGDDGGGGSRLCVWARVRREESTKVGPEGCLVKVWLLQGWMPTVQ